MRTLKKKIYLGKGGEGGSSDRVEGRGGDDGGGSGVVGIGEVERRLEVGEALGREVRLRPGAEEQGTHDGRRRLVAMGGSSGEGEPRALSGGGRARAWSPG